MPTFLIEPTDVLFFRDGIPMSSGMGNGAGCRLPFPSTLHEALRASLLKANGEEVPSADITGRGGKKIATKAYQSLRAVGPFPYREDRGILLPVPLDAAFDGSKGTLHRLQLLAQTGASAENNTFTPACLPVATTPPDKHGRLQGWWAADQYKRYLCGETVARDGVFQPIPTEELWSAEHRMGLAIDPATLSAKDGQLFAGSYMRVHSTTRFCLEASAADNAEQQRLHALDWVLLGGDRRLARLWRQTTSPFDALREPLAAPVKPDGPALLKWALVTPAIFAHGSLPGWCQDTKRDRPGGPLPAGRVCLDLPGKASLVSWCLGKPQTVTGWDALRGEAKPTQLAVPAGSVFYFLCENAATATALAQKLHWQPRSDHYGEKGCGYGLVSFDTTLHPTSPDIRQLAASVFHPNIIP